MSHKVFGTHLDSHILAFGIIEAFVLIRYMKMFTVVVSNACLSLYSIWFVIASLILITTEALPSCLECSKCLEDYIYCLNHCSTEVPDTCLAACLISYFSILF